MTANTIADWMNPVIMGLGWLPCSNRIPLHGYVQLLP